MTYNLARIRERELLGHIQRASMVEEFDKRQGTTWIQTNEIAFREFSYLAPISAFVSDSPYIYQSLDVATRETFINKIEDTGELAAWQWLLLEKPNIFTSEDFPPSGTPFEVWNKKRAGWLKMITYIKENSPQK